MTIRTRNLRTRLLALTGAIAVAIVIVAVACRESTSAGQSPASPARVQVMTSESASGSDTTHTAQVAPVQVKPFHDGVAPSSPNGGSASVTGSVITSDGQPVPGAEVEIQRDPTRGDGPAVDGPALARTTTDFAGRFTLGGIVASEAYLLRVEHERFQVGVFRPVHTQVPASLHPTIVLEDGGTLSGVVRSQEGTPLGSARVAIYSSSEQVPPVGLRFERAVDTNPDGSFRIGHLAAGPKRVVTQKLGYATEVVEGFRFSAAPDERALEITLAFGSTIKGRVVDATRGTPLANVPLSARIAGPSTASQGLGKDGTPMAAAPKARAAGSNPRIDPTVAMVTVDASGTRSVQFAYPQWLRDRAWFDLSVTSDADGTFEFVGVHDGDYVLAVADESYSQGTEWLVHAGDDDVTIDVAPGLILAGRIVDEETGAAVSPAVVAVGGSPEAGLVPAEKRHQIDDGDGRFQLSAPRTSVSYIHVWASGFAPFVSGPYLPNGPDRVDSIVVALRRGATIDGAVKDSAGRGLAGVSVSLVDPLPDATGIDDSLRFLARRSMGALAACHAVTDAQGMFKITGVPAGRMAIKTEHPEFAEMVGAPFVCGGRGTERIADVVLARGARLDGVVRGLQGHTAHLLVRGMTPGSPVRTIELAPNGVFQCAGLPAGTYQLITMRDGRSDPAQFLAQTNAAPKIELHEGEIRGDLALGEEPVAAPERPKD